MSDSLSDLLHSRSEQVHANLPPAGELRHRAEQGRRNRRLTGVATLAVVAALAVAINPPARLSPTPEPAPVTTPTPAPTALTLAADPFLREDYFRGDFGRESVPVRHSRSVPTGLVSCVGDPSVWGAVELQGVTWVDRDLTPREVINEFVMRFASADQAEQALTDARREAFANCPTPKEVGPRHARRGEFEVDPLPQESRFDEGWFLSFDQTPSRGPSDSFVYYATRTANVVVVIETNGWFSPSGYVLGQAMERAIGAGP